MIIKKAGLSKYKVYLGTDNKNSKIITVIHAYNRKISTISNNYKNKVYVLYEPIFLFDIHPLAFEYEYYLQGIITKKRKFIKLDKAVSTLKKAYRRFFRVLANDPDINPYYLDKEDIEYLEKYLPKDNKSKYVLIKLKKLIIN